MDEEATLQPPDYVRHASDFFSTTWKEILPPNGKRPVVELNALDTRPSIVVEEAVPEVVAVAAVPETPEVRAFRHIEGGGSNSGVSINLVLPESLDGHSFRGTLGNDVVVHIDTNSPHAQDVTTRTQAYFDVAGATGSLRLTLPESIGFGDFTGEEDLFGAAGNNWEAFLVAGAPGINPGAWSARKAHDPAPETNTNGRIEINFGDSAANITLGEISAAWNGITSQAGQYNGGASSSTIAASSVFGTANVFANGVTGESATALVRRSTGAGGLTLTMPSDDARFQRAAGNRWEFRLIHDSTLATDGDQTIVVDDVAETITATIRVNTLARVKSLWDGQTGSFSSAYTGGAGGSSPAHADSLFTTANPHASATVLGDGTGNSVSVSLINDDYYGIDLAGAAGNAVKLRMFFNQDLDGDHSRVRIRATEDPRIYFDHNHNTSNANAVAALLNEGTSFDPVVLPDTAEQWVFTIGNAPPQTVSTATIKAFTAATVGSAIPSGQYLNFISTDPSADIHIGRDASNQLVVETTPGSRLRIDITVRKIVIHHMELMFSGPTATLQQVEDAWEAPQRLDPHTVSDDSRLEGIGVGGLGGMAVVTGDSSAFVAQGQGTLDFSGGVGAKDDTRVRFADGKDGIVVGVTNYLYFADGMAEMSGLLPGNMPYQLIIIRLKDNNLHSVDVFWEKPQSDGGIGGMVELLGTDYLAISDVTWAFGGGSDRVRGVLGTPGSAAIPAVTRKGNSTPDSKLRLRWRERTGEKRLVAINTVPQITLRGEAVVRPGTPASTLVADADSSTTGGLRLWLPRTWGRNTPTAGTLDGLGNNGNAYALRFVWDENGALGGRASAVVSGTEIRVSIEKHSDDTNPTIGDLLTAWTSFGGFASLEGTTAADEALSDVSVYTAANQMFSGGIHPHIDLVKTPNTLTVRDQNDEGSITTYSSVAAISDLSSGFNFHQNDKRLSFHSSHIGRTLTVEYDLESDQVEFHGVEESVHVLTVGSGITWTNLAAALNANNEFIRLFHRIVLDDDLILPATHAGNAMDKPMPGTYEFVNGGWSERQRAVVSVPSTDNSSLLSADPPLSEKFAAVTGSAQTVSIDDATTNTLMLSLSHSDSSASFDEEGQSATGDVTADGNWHFDGKTLTYWTDTAGNVTAQYANNFDENMVVIAEGPGDTEVVLEKGKSLYGKNTEHSEGGVEAYDDKSGYPWVYGHAGFPREASESA